MESPLTIYKELSHIDNIGDIAYDRLYTNYLIKNLKGAKKKIEWNSTDQESLIKLFNFGIPVPGMVYTFWYIPEELLMIDFNKQQNEFIDYAPLMFCTSIIPTHFSGINLNMLPKIERLKFFEEYYKFYKGFFKDVERQTENNQIALNDEFIIRSLSRKSQEMIRAFSKRQSANFNYGYRKYDFKKARQLRMVEYEEWGYIPFYDPKAAFKKMNIKQIHDIYYRTK